MAVSRKRSSSKKAMKRSSSKKGRVLELKGRVLELKGRVLELKGRIRERVVLWGGTTTKSIYR
jgi:hypothetical protein